MVHQIMSVISYYIYEFMKKAHNPNALELNLFSF